MISILLSSKFKIISVYCRSELNTKYFNFCFLKTPVKIIVSHIFLNRKYLISSYPLHLDTLKMEKKPQTTFFFNHIIKDWFCKSLLCTHRNFYSTCNYLKREIRTCICLMLNIKFPCSELHKKSDSISAVLYKESKPSI